MSEKLKEKDVKNEISAFLKRCDDKGNTLLHYVAKSDDYEFAEKLISAGCDVNKRNRDGHSPLVSAIHKNKLEMIKVLLKAGADYNNDDFAKKMRPLHIAASLAYPEIVQLFVQLKVDLDARSDSGETALHYAVKFNNNETESNDRCRIIKILIDAGADINLVDNMEGTPLLDACSYDFTAGFELLINMGASIHREGIIDTRFFSQIMESPNLQLLKRLIEIGYDINTSDIFGNSCLHDAALYSKSEIIEFLFENGAVITVNNGGFDPLCYGLCYLHEDYDFTETDDDDDDPDRKIENIENHEVYTKQIKAVRTLIKYGSNINHVTNDGDTPLYIVLRNFKYLHSDFARVLLDNGAKIDFNHPSVLRVINYSSNSKFPHLLLRHTAMFEAQNRNNGPVNFDLNKLNEKARKEYARCRDELELMKTTKIDETNVSFFNILVNRDIGPYTRNEHITRSFESTSLVSKRFPIYGDLMCERFSKEFKFQEIVEAASNGLGYILNWDENTTHMLLSNILSYLDRNDLDNLVEI